MNSKSNQILSILSMLTVEVEDEIQGRQKRIIDTFAFIRFEQNDYIAR